MGAWLVLDPLVSHCLQRGAGSHPCRGGAADGPRAGSRGNPAQLVADLALEPGRQPIANQPMERRNLRLVQGQGVGVEP